MPSKINWNEDFLGVAYRYFDLRMNVIPLFYDRKKATDIWSEYVHWWTDHDIKLRFVESDDKYWFVIASETKRPDHNMAFFKILPKSENYTRFKKGHLGEAYFRFATYSEKQENEVKDNAVCQCTHEKEDHDDNCQIDGCKCEKFQTFELRIFKKKKTITDIKFLEEQDIKNDSVSWNCFYANKFKNSI